MMPWLKGQSCHAHGYGQPQYEEIHEDADIEDMKASFDFLFPDRDGFRTPKFEVLDKLPADVLNDKIEHAIGAIAGYERLLKRLLAERDAASNAG